MKSLNSAHAVLVILSTFVTGTRAATAGSSDPSAVDNALRFTAKEKEAEGTHLLSEASASSAAQQPRSQPHSQRNLLDGLSTVVDAEDSFDECVILESVSGLKDATDPDGIVPCCDQFPDEPFCAYLACLDEACECDVIAGLLTDVEQGTSVYAAQTIGEQGLGGETAWECCQEEGMSLVDFLACTSQITSNTPAPPDYWSLLGSDEKPISFAECLIFQPVVDENTDRTMACCVDSPDDPYCARIASCSDEGNELNCGCSVIVEAFAEMDTGPLALLLGGEDPGIAAASEGCCQAETSIPEFQACMDGAFSEETDDDFTWTWSPTSSPAPEVCPDESEALENCHATEEGLFGFLSIGCSFCQVTVPLEDWGGFASCDGKKDNGFCGAYAKCASEQCSTGCMNEAYDYLHCHLSSTDDCDLQCSPEDAIPYVDSTAISTITSNGPFDFLSLLGSDDTPISFAECLIFQPVVDESTDRTMACCVDSPDDPYCARIASCTDEGNELNCGCSVIVEAFAEMDTGPLAQLLGGQDPGISAASEGCCQEETSIPEFQACMDSAFSEETDDDFAWTWSPTSSPAPEVNIESTTNDLADGGDSVTTTSSTISTANVIEATIAAPTENGTSADPTTTTPTAIQIPNATEAAQTTFSDTVDENTDIDRLTSGAIKVDNVVAFFISTAVVGGMQLL